MQRIALILLLAVLLLSITACDKKGNPELVAIKLSLTNLRSVYEAEIASGGDAENLTVDEALEKAQIGDVMQTHWDFEVLGNPPKRYMATSTDTNKIGEGKKIWYDTEDKSFHGYFLDEEE
ncbi:MAG: hypothetical protein JXR56_01000 [Candidatus Cloacimonetes bacterium]|nr:hypothetical protein [Candidatus Cloacimonadota bacterium]